MFYLCDVNFNNISRNNFVFFLNISRWWRPNRRYVGYQRRGRNGRATQQHQTEAGREATAHRAGQATDGDASEQTETTARTAGILASCHSGELCHHRFRDNVSSKTGDVLSLLYARLFLYWELTKCSLCEKIRVFFGWPKFKNITGGYCNQRLWCQIMYENICQKVLVRQTAR